MKTKENSVAKPYIIACVIGPFPLNSADERNPHVRVLFHNGKSKDLFWFDADKMRFNEKDFIGLTEDQARELHIKELKKQLELSDEQRTKRTEALRQQGYY